MANRRWDGDERADGVADAGQFVEGAAELLAAMQRPNWISEEPEVHLLPHLAHACELLPLQILATRTSNDGCYEVQLRWTGENGGVGAVRAAVVSLLGAIAEPAGYVGQRRTEPHWHTLRLDVVTA